MADISTALILDAVTRARADPSGVPLHTQQAQVAELVTVAQRWQTGLEALQTAVGKVLQQIPPADNPIAPMPYGAGSAPSANGSAILPAELLTCLTQWQASGSSGDC